MVTERKSDTTLLGADDAFRLVVDGIVASVITVGVYVSFLDATLPTENGTRALVAVFIGGVLGFATIYFDTTVEIGTRTAILVLLLTLSIGFVLIPDGLPDVVWVGILALIWTNIASELIIWLRRPRDDS